MSEPVLAEERVKTPWLTIFNHNILHNKEITRKKEAAFSFANKTPNRHSTNLDVVKSVNFMLDITSTNSY